MRSRIAAAILAAAMAAAPRALPAAGVAGVSIVSTPNGGIQPQAIVDPNGTIHLLYFSGEPAHGDLFYVRRGARDSAFTPPIAVNSIRGSAIATGSVRGGQLAIGRGGRVHVAWNSSQPIDRDGASHATMWYARLAPGGTSFDPQRAIGTQTKNLDGGGSIAADAAGAVYVTWHAAGTVEGEQNRRLYVAASRDDGGTFGPERTIAVEGGACGCCGVETIVDTGGRLQLLYRAAGGGVHRDAMWLTPGAPSPITLQPWELPACPMTTFAMANGPDGIVAAWETQQQIYSAVLSPGARLVPGVSAMSGTALRKHPAIAVNAAGDALFAWTEGTAWARGGSVAWELRSRRGVRLAGAAGAAPVPVWSLVAAVARPDGGFVVIH